MILKDLTLKGFQKILRVYAKKYNENEYDINTNEYKVSDNNWMIETDGVDLIKIF